MDTHATSAGGGASGALGPTTAPAPDAARLERTAMAWPPATWERAPGHWRDDVLPGGAPLEPFDPPGEGEAARIPEAAAPERPADAPATATTSSGARRAAREVIEVVGLALVLFAAIRFASQNYLIERESMLPTLQSGNMVLVDKLGYRFGHGPRRGDVVVFHAWSAAGEKDFVKRVVGLPGDTLAVRGGHVEIDGAALDEPYVDGAPTGPDVGPVVLSDDEYYVMGDNRANSVDSRSYGPLPADRIVGRAWLRYWPLDAFGTIPGSASEALATPPTGNEAP